MVEQPQSNWRPAEDPKALLAAIVESSDDAIVSKTLDGIVTSWNSAAERIFGYAADEIVESPIRILFPPDRLNEEDEILERLRRGERVDHFETVRVRKDGTLIEVSVTISPVRDPGGRLAGASKVVRDITERNRAREALRDQQEWFRVTLYSIGDGVIATDRAGCVTFMNPIAEELTGWTQNEGRGRPLEAVFRIVSETTRETVENPAVRALREGTVVGLANHTILLTKNGREWPIDDSAAPIRNQRGEILGVVLVFHEVAKQRQLEGELRQRSAELAAADQRKNEFLAMLAHELRNPLGPILNAVYALENLGPRDWVLERYRGMIQRQAHHLSRLVDDLLEVSRITRGLIDLRLEVVDLRDVVAQSLDTVRPLAEDRHQELVASIHREAALCVEGDHHRLVQVMDNLLSNAVKYTQPSGRIEVTVVREADTAVISVRDEGSGISRELLPHVFDLFTQGDRSLARSEGGLGIGLAMVKMLVEAHGGQVEAHSAGHGEGSEFIVRLPGLSTDQQGANLCASPAATPTAHAAAVRVSCTASELGPGFI